MMYYVYIHYKPDGEPFYVGKGKGRRAYDFRDRQNAYYLNVVAKYGAENITVRVFFQPDEDTAFRKEKELIALLRSAGYHLANMTDGGEGPSGRKASAETKERQSLARKGRKASPEACANISAALKGKPKSAEHRAKLSAAKRGKPGPADMTGYKHTPESRAKMSAARKGKKQTPEHIAKRTAGVSARMKGHRYNVGRVASEETRQKISAAKKGTKASPETRAKMSARMMGNQRARKKP